MMRMKEEIFMLRKVISELEFACGPDEQGGVKGSLDKQVWPESHTHGQIRFFIEIPSEAAIDTGIEMGATRTTFKDFSILPAETFAIHKRSHIATFQTNIAHQPSLIDALPANAATDDQGAVIAGMAISGEMTTHNPGPISQRGGSRGLADGYFHTESDPRMDQ